MRGRKRLTPEQTADLNRVLRRLAEDLEAGNARRAAFDHADKLARDVLELCEEMAWCPG